MKYLVHKYISHKYNEIFREIRGDNYVAYSYHYELKNDEKMGKKADVEKFSKFLLKILEGISVDELDKVVYDDMIERLTLRLFLPKQKNTDNRVIPLQLYEYELKSILKNTKN